MRVALPFSAERESMRQAPSSIVTPAQEHKPENPLVSVKDSNVSLASTATADSSPRSPATSQVTSESQGPSLGGQGQRNASGGEEEPSRPEAIDLYQADVQGRTVPNQVDDEVTIFSEGNDDPADMSNDGDEESGKVVATTAEVEAFSNPQLLELFGSYQDGDKHMDFWDGDVAVLEGHWSLMHAKLKTGDHLSYTHLAANRAAKHGRLDMVKWLLEFADVELTQEAMDGAAAQGHLEIVEFLAEHPRSVGCTKFAMNRAAAGGHLEVVRRRCRRSCSLLFASDGLGNKWLHDYRTEGCTHTAMDGAATEGHLEMVQWLHENQSEGCTVKAMDGAAGNGHLSVVQWLHRNRSEGCTGEAMFAAAKHGYVDVVRWLFRHRSERCPPSRNIMDWTAANGHLEVLKFLHAEGVEGCTVRAMDWAAGNGHLETVKWLHEIEQGCTKQAMDGAAEDGHLDVVRWLHENRREGGTIRAMNRAAGNGHLDVVRWLNDNRKEGCSNSAMDNAAKNGYLEIVQFLHENRGEGCSTNALDWASARGHLDVVLFLVNNRREGATERALDWSQHSGHREIYCSLRERARLRPNTTREVGAGFTDSCCTIA